MDKKTILLAAGGAMMLLTASCVHVSSDPIRVEPIHIVADINLRVDRQLDDFFAFQNQYRSGATTQPTTAPATQPQTAVAP